MAVETWRNGRNPPAYDDDSFDDGGFSRNPVVRGSYRRALKSEDAPAADQTNVHRSFSSSRIERTTYEETTTGGDIETKSPTSWFGNTRSKLLTSSRRSHEDLPTPQRLPLTQESHIVEQSEKRTPSSWFQSKVDQYMAKREGSFTRQRSEERPPVSNRRPISPESDDFIIIPPAGDSSPYAQRKPFATPKIEEVYSQRLPSPPPSFTSSATKPTSRPPSRPASRGGQEMVILPRRHQPQPTSPEEIDAETLRNAIQGVGVDSTSALRLLCERTNEQRQDIRKAYEHLYDRDLMKDLIELLYRDCEPVIVALMLPPDEYDAIRLHKAVVGQAPVEATVNEIMCTRTNRELVAIEIAYKRLYNKDLESDLKKITSNFYRRVVIALCGARRSENANVNERDAVEDAQILLETLRHPPNSKHEEQDEAEMVRIFCLQHPLHLRRVFYHYGVLSQASLNGLSMKFKPDAEQCLIMIVKAMKNRPKLFAELLQQALSGPGRTDEMLVRVIVCRAEADLPEIRDEFERMYNKSLVNTIEDNTTGRTREALLSILERDY